MTDVDRDSLPLPDGPDGDSLGRLIRAVGRRPSPSATEYERVRLAAHLAWQMKVHGRRRRFVWLALAASVAAAAVVVTTLPSPPSSVAELTLARGSVERFAPREGRWEALSSGAQIEPGSTLRASSDGGAVFAMGSGIVIRVRAATEWTFDDATRLTLDEGTLYVDTGPVPDARRKLEIVTQHGILRHVGTQYEVRALSSQLRVRVREGRVRVEGRAPESTHDASAAQELLVTAEGATDARPFATDSPEWQWAQALATPLELEGRSAFDALQWIAREIGKRLTFEDANAELLARRSIIHGNGADLEPLQLLEIVMATSPGLDYSIGDGTLVIRRR